jgi:hypothetical protein
MNIGLTRKEQGGLGEQAMLPSYRARLDCRNGMAVATAGLTLVTDLRNKHLAVL